MLFFRSNTEPGVDIGKRDAIVPGIRKNKMEKNQGQHRCQENRMKRVTIIDIAEECGCSKTTVACAMDERTAHKVAEPTRNRIRETAKRLGYVPNRSAKALRQHRTHTIGILLPEPANGFYGNLVMNLQRQLAQAGYAAFFIFWETFSDVHDIRKMLHTLLSRGVDGIIAGQPSNVLAIEECGVPVVLWQETEENFDTFSSYPCVKEAYGELLDILCGEKGCKTFAVMSKNPDLGRARIISELCLERGLGLPQLIGGVDSMAKAKNAMQLLIAEKNKTPLPDVILANNDYIALAAMTEAMNSGIRVPEEMRFVGFDGVPVTSYLCPSLTTFCIPPEMIAEKLIGLLMNRMQHPDAPYQHLSMQPELIRGGSI